MQILSMLNASAAVAQCLFRSAFVVEGFAGAVQFSMLNQAFHSPV